MAALHSVLILVKGKGGGPLADEISYSCPYIVSPLDNYCELVQLIAIQNYAPGDRGIDPKTRRDKTSYERSTTRRVHDKRGRKVHKAKDSEAQEKCGAGDEQLAFDDSNASIDSSLSFVFRSGKAFRRDQH